ncbi:uncharacterized protein N7483_002637 [Penicillium malachiteum]|uniref:uncharacterized protein n=1 Tax=Penicillium malachiteum TaxID=1324776 RepID=UPI00254841D3|nr:uncharacterized protein N7483_002637 [Penicillium malachiteum]KAJ5737512.1 hypothetical protein N7483_002637 [Penicillium malachiteum]
MSFYEPEIPEPPSIDLPKPTFPYTSGWKFVAKSHIAPTATPVLRNCCLNVKGDRIERSELDPVDRCLKHPPLPGSLGNYLVELEVIELIKGGDGQHCQILRVRLGDVKSDLQSKSSNSRHIYDLKKDTVLVAKIYDPLYFDDEEGYLNPFVTMDQFYSHEVNAYMALDKFQGREIPMYYGSFTFNLPVDSKSKKERAVRMILGEHIQGITMAEATPGSIPQQSRQSIMRSIVDLESRIYENDVFLMETAPQNILLVSSDSDHPRIIFLDFAHALFGRRTDDPVALDVNLFLGEYISPLLRWREKSGHITSFLKWVDWDWDSWLDAEFAYTVATIKPGMRERWSYEDEEDFEPTGCCPCLR